MITPQDMLEWLGEQFPENIGMMPRDRMIADAIRDFITEHSWQPIETAPKDDFQSFLVGRNEDDDLCKACRLCHNALPSRYSILS